MGRPWTGWKRSVTNRMADNIEGKPAESFAQAVAFAMNQPDEVDVSAILFRPTRRELEVLAQLVVACYAIAERTVARIFSIAVFRFSSALRAQ
jgi:hypothetical protein